jgi:hypothetical protein
VSKESFVLQELNFPACWKEDFDVRTSDTPCVSAAVDCTKHLLYFYI